RCRRPRSARSCSSWCGSATRSPGWSRTRTRRRSTCSRTKAVLARGRAFSRPGRTGHTRAGVAAALGGQYSPLCMSGRLVLTLALAVGAALPAPGWTMFTPALRPPGRSFHALACDFVRGVTVLFGGWNGTPFGDTWEWSGAGWTQRTLATSPPARCCHAMAYLLVHGNVVLFGGTPGTAIDLNDTWEYDGVNCTQRQPTHSPGPRREVRMASDVAHGNVVLFGGGVGGLGVPVFADTWLWDGVDWALAAP